MSESDDVPSETAPRPPAFHQAASGVLLAGVGAPFLALSSHQESVLHAPRWAQASTVVVASCWLVAGLVIARFPPLGRKLALASCIGTAALALPYLARSPFTTLITVVTSSAALALLFNLGGPPRTASPSAPPPEGRRARGAAFTTVALWFATAISGAAHPRMGLWAVSAAALIAAGLTLAWAARAHQRHPLRVASIAACTLLTASLVAWFWGNWSAVLACAVVSNASFVILVRPSHDPEFEEGDWSEIVIGHPERLLVGTFAALSLAGTLLLALPESASAKVSIGLVDALFTAVSAVCVTGLIVLDTPVDFSLFGQGVILGLVQTGGLGIMTFSTVALMAFGRRVSLRHEGAAARLIGTPDRRRVFDSAWRILLLTFSVEFVGAVVLWVLFLRHGDGFGQALWRAVFTSISAFCNSGFALQSTSLIPYQGDPLVLHTVASLIILGGLSPAVVFTIPTLIRRPEQPVPVQARLILVTSAVLLLLGFVATLAFEWDAALRGLSYGDRLHNAWFHSATLRTAGFNSVDMVALTPATVTLMMALMLIGGSPGSTAGGIKTTTAAVLFLSVIRAVSGQWSLNVFGRRISERTRHRAAVIVTVALTGLVAAIIALQLTQRMPIQSAVFEVVSALGTVGLSLGGTAQLDGIGKLVIITCMFVGRVGGMALMMYLAQRRGPAVLKRPEEDVDVG